MAPETQRKYCNNECQPKPKQKILFHTNINSKYINQINQKAQQVQLTLFSPMYFDLVIA